MSCATTGGQRSSMTTDIHLGTDGPRTPHPPPLLVDNPPVHPCALRYEPLVDESAPGSTLYPFSRRDSEIRVLYPSTTQNTVS